MIRWDGTTVARYVGRHRRSMTMLRRWQHGLLVWWTT